MITKEEYLEALKIVNQYRLQLKSGLPETAFEWIVNEVLLNDPESTEEEITELIPMAVAKFKSNNKKKIDV